MLIWRSVTFKRTGSSPIGLTESFNLLRASVIDVRFLFASAWVKVPELIRLFASSSFSLNSFAASSEYCPPKFPIKLLSMISW